MNGLALYSGIAGLELGLKLAVPGYRTVCYVEREAYPASRLVACMEEKVLDEAVVWDDAETFDGTAWRRKVDIISAGFPCQPVSVAGKRQGHKDKRWQWPTVRRIVREVRPSFVFLENVPGIKPYIPGITADLTEIGYRWTYGFLSAAGCGAPHKRIRWFCLGYTSECGCSRFDRRRSGQKFENGREEIPNAPDNGCSRSRLARTGRNGFEDCGEDVPDTEREQTRGLCESQSQSDIRTSCRRNTERVKLQGQNWWAIEPDVGRVAHGVPFRVDRLRALGNAVVPIVAATAWRILLANLFEAGMIDV